jgi:hypothetical protein
LIKWIKNYLKGFVVIPGYCKRCGKGMLPVFQVDNEVWFRVVGDTGTEYCINCFDKLARKKGIYIIYTNIREVK